MTTTVEVNIVVSGNVNTWRGQINSQLSAALIAEGNPKILKAMELFNQELELEPNQADALLGQTTMAMGFDEDGNDAKLEINVTEA